MARAAPLEAIKPGVRLMGIQPQMAIAHAIVRDVYRNAGHKCRLTSGGEGEHSPKSLHYRGLALDFGILHVPRRERQAVADALATALADEFDVVYRDGKNHIHVEWDPGRK